MQELIAYQNKLLEQIPGHWQRSAFDHFHWEQRLLGIKGLRGVGKTTMMLQYLKHHYPEPDLALYVTADAPWFYSHSLYELAEEWHKYGGKLLIMDEIHKYPLWSRELKVSYEAFPDMQFIFSASSAFDLFKGEADLSRRAVIEELPGMAFREYLQLVHGTYFEPISLESLLNRPADWAKYVNQFIKPLPLFLDYLKRGYFPFSCLENDWGINLAHLTNIVNTILERDLAFIEDYSASNVLKIKRLLGVIAEAAPFEPNISKIAQKLKLGRNTVYNYLKHLADARLLNFLHKQGKSIAALQKPDKLYFENPNMAMAYGKSADTGALRETFFINQLRNAGHRVALADKGDFIIDDQYTFEIGGPNKTTKQIKGLPESYLAMDNIEYGFDRQIPLWLFGFLY